MAYEFVVDTGVIVADTSADQVEVENEFKAVFGDDLDLGAGTPEGVLISAEVASRAGIANNNAQLANQINPNEAGGVFLDSLWALTGGARVAATSSTFVTAVDVTGVPATLISEGSLAETTSGDQFATLGDVTLDGSGLGTVFFASVVKGAIAAPIGTLTTIITLVLGWETVNNTVAATLGTATQSDISVRAERNQTLGLQGSGLAVSVFSNVRAVAGVLSLTFRENETASPVVLDGITLVANSVWVGVDGGSDADVAAALLASKSAGANWNNANGIAVSEMVTDPTSGQIYTVLFSRPDLIPVLYRVTITASTISNVTTIIENAIVAYANGELDGEEGLVVGADVSPFEAAAAINQAEPGINITNVEVTIAAVVDFQPTTIAIELFEKATTTTTSITVVVV